MENTVNTETTEETLSSEEISDRKIQNRINIFKSQAPTIAAFVPYFLVFGSFFLVLGFKSLATSFGFGAFMVLGGTVAFSAGSFSIFKVVQMIMDHNSALIEKLESKIDRLL